MGKKSNTVLFMLLATLLNVVVMVVLFVLFTSLVIKFANPESSLVPVYMILAFVASIGFSILIYSKVLKWLSSRFQLEDKLAPLWNRKKRN